MWDRILGWLLGLGEVSVLRIEDVSLGAPWAQGNGLFWVFLGAVCLAIIAVMFYFKFQTRGSVATRIALAGCRGALLILVFLTLADPFIRIYDESFPQPLIYVLFDGTESMSIEDEFSAEEQKSLASAVGLAEQDAKPTARVELVKALISKDEQNLIKRLQEEKNYRVETFIFEGANTSQLRRVKGSETGDVVDPKFLAQQLSASGQVTAIGTVLDEMNQQLGKGNLAGVVMFSDYASNSGGPAVGEAAGGRPSPVSRLQVPIHTVGVGATQAIDLAVDVRPELKMKRAERSNVNVKWTQTGLDGKSANVEVFARRLDGGESASIIPVGQKLITFDDVSGNINLPFTPQEAGQFEFIAEVDEQDGEVVLENNKSQREVNVIDDYLRLMYVAYEPTWEWRFVKEVFHRDKLVGMRGFRTYLRSADPKVRQSNELFLPTLTPKRSDFFASDIVFLDDMPQSALSQRYGEMLKEFVGEFGGGLVVIAGPRFGPGQLAGTPIADMLPVEVDPALRVRDEREFVMQLTPQGLATDFMQLGDSQNEAENVAAWRNLGEIPWYQPVRKPHPLAEVLAEHPTDTCVDGKTKQPIIAIRRYGKGEVVYVAFNETWRLRRKYGELYYRQFWSQIMNRLALSHALGNQKRFVVRTDRQNYKVDDRVNVIVEAYDENFERLRADKLPEGKLIGELYLPDASEPTQNVSLTPLRDGEFEARIPAVAAGEYRLRVNDPVEGEYREVRFRAASLSAERRNAQRNEHLQQQIARESGGHPYDLTNVGNLVSDLDLKPVAKTTRHNKALWATPLWFILVVGLMAGEWFFRKMNNLT